MPQYTITLSSGEAVEYWLHDEPEFALTHPLAQSIIKGEPNEIIKDWRVIYGLLTHFQASGISELPAVVNESITHWTIVSWKYPEYMMLIHITGLHDLTNTIRACFRSWYSFCEPEKRDRPVTDDNTNRNRAVKQVIYSTVNLFVEKLVVDAIKWDHIVLMAAFYRDYDFGTVFSGPVDGVYAHRIADLDQSRRDGLAIFAGQPPFCRGYRVGFGWL